MHLNQTQTANYFGVSPRRIRTLEAEGWFSRDSAGRYDISEVSERFEAMDPTRRPSRALDSSAWKRESNLWAPAQEFVRIPAVDDPSFPAHIHSSLYDTLDRHADALRVLNELAECVRLHGLKVDIQKLDGQVNELLHGWYINESNEDRDYWDYHLDPIRAKIRQDLAVLCGHSRNELEYAGGQDREVCDALLIGDAATMTRPRTASGATKALEDALALESLAMSSASLSDLLREYDALRCEGAKVLAQIGRRIGKAQVINTPDWGSMGPSDFADRTKAMLAGDKLYLYGEEA